jgi:hypothetical protein
VYQSENYDGKMILLAQQTGETRGWKFDDENVPRMMALLTPARMQLLQMMVEVEPQVSASGVYALMKVWIGQKRIALEARSKDAEGTQTQLLRSLEYIIERLLGVYGMTPVDEDVLSQVKQVDLVQAFTELCRNSQDGNINSFVMLLKTRGIFDVTNGG